MCLSSGVESIFSCEDLRGSANIHLGNGTPARCAQWRGTFLTSYRKEMGADCRRVYDRRQWSAVRPSAVVPRNGEGGPRRFSRGHAAYPSEPACTGGLRTRRNRSRTGEGGTWPGGHLAGDPLVWTLALALTS